MRVIYVIYTLHYIYIRYIIYRNIYITNGGSYVLPAILTNPYHLPKATAAPCDLAVGLAVG